MYMLIESRYPFKINKLWHITDGIKKCDIVFQKVVSKIFMVYTIKR